MTKIALISAIWILCIVIAALYDAKNYAAKSYDQFKEIACIESGRTYEAEKCT